MSAVWIAVIAISLLGLIFGLILGYASRRFCRKASAGSVAILAAAPMPKR